MGALGKLVDVDAERAVLAVLLGQAPSGAAAVREAIDVARLEVVDFGAEPHGYTFAAISDLARSGQVPDFVTVADALKRAGRLAEVGGARGLMALGSLLVVSASLTQYAATVREMALRRRLVREAQALMEEAQDASLDVGQLLGQAPTRFATLQQRTEDWKTLAEAMRSVGQKIHEANTVGGKQPVLKTGIRSLDKVLGGLPYNLTIVAAQPGVGKGALAAAWMQAWARMGVISALCSLEDRKEWLAWRYLADASGVDSFVLRTRKLNAVRWEAVGDGFARVAEWQDRVLLNDRERLTPGQVLSACREAVRVYGAQVVLVDNLTSMRWKVQRESTKTEAIGEFLLDLRALAIELDVPAVAFAHVKRREGLTQEKMPHYTDIADTSSPEKVARVILGLARDPQSDTMDVGILKANEGPGGYVVPLRFHGAAAIVRDIEGTAPLFPEQDE